jgi:DNA-binding NtrC family response regulator
VSRRGADGLARIDQALAAAADLEGAVDAAARRAALEALVERAEAALRALRRGGPGRPPREALRDLFVGRPEALERLAPQLERVLGATQPVLVEGEPGTGKRSVAAALHEAAADRGPLARVAHPVGADEVRRRARGAGALLCEDVSNLSADAQGALLALLRGASRRAPRVIATTRHDLDAAVAAGWFLPELRDRLHVLRLRLPPLREHPAAAPALFAHLLRLRAGAGAAPRVSAAALDALRAHAWPGNAREVDAAARAILGWLGSGAAVEGDHVSRFLAQVATSNEAPAAAPRDDRTLAAVERDTIEERLARLEWRQVETARSLGIDRKTLYRRIRELGLERPR